MARKTKDRPSPFLEMKRKHNSIKKQMPRWRVVPTGIYELDHEVLGCGGIPIGTMTGLAGQPSSGKTSLCDHISACFQRQSGSVSYNDIEGTFDSDWAERLGVSFADEHWDFEDTNKSAEHAYQRMFDFLGLADLIVLDSVAMMMPAEELAKGIIDEKTDEATSERIAGRARTNRRCLTMIVWGKQDETNLRNSNTAVLLVNQLTANIGSHGDKNTEAGGSGVKFGCSIMLRMSRKSQMADTLKTGVVKFKVKNTKNKLALPFRECSIFLDVEEAKFWPCDAKKWVALAEKVEDLQVFKEKGFIRIGDQHLKGYREVAQYLREHYDLVGKVLSGKTEAEEVEEE